MSNLKNLLNLVKAAWHNVFVSIVKLLCACINLYIIIYSPLEVAQVTEASCVCLCVCVCGGGGVPGISLSFSKALARAKNRLLILALHVEMATYMYLCDCGYKINYATKETRLHGSEIICEGK